MKTSFLAVCMMAVLAPTGVSTFSPGTIVPAFARRDTSVAHQVCPQPKTGRSFSLHAEPTTDQQFDVVLSDIKSIEKELDEFEVEEEADLGDVDKDDERIVKRIKKKLGLARKVRGILRAIRKFKSGLKDKTAIEQVLAFYEKDPTFFDDQPIGRKKVTTNLDELSESTGPILNFLVEKARERVKEKVMDQNPESLFAVLDLLDSVLDVLLGDDMGYGEFKNHPEFPDVELQSLMKIMKRDNNLPPPLEYSFSLRKIIRLVKLLVKTTLGLSFGEARAREGGLTAEESFAAWFSPKESPLKLLPAPTTLIEQWKEDREMARQFLAGVHTLMIQVCNKPEEQLSPSLMDYFEEASIDVQQLATEKRLLFATYEELSNLEKNPHYVHYSEEIPEDARYYQASKIVFEMDVDRDGMDILAIELDMDQEAKKPEVFSRSKSSDTAWLMAKTCIANADSQFHEWISHLGATHLTIEPHIIAIHNTLRSGKRRIFRRRPHPLWDFLEPLTHDTLLLNWAARRTLASYEEGKSIGDRQSSVGVGQYLQILRNRWDHYHFFRNSSLVEELEQRGFDEDFEFPAYMYREDGLKLFNAIGEFASDFVDEVYDTDKEVERDGLLQEWAEETTNPDKGDVKGFPPSFKTKDSLVKTLQTLWWIASGLHAAVNFPQYEYLAYVPNKPQSMNANMTGYQDQSDDKAEWIFEKALPGINSTKEIIQIGRVLTLPSNHNIDQLSGHYANTRHGKVSYEKFLAKLDAIGDEIEARNQALKKEGKPVYHYLHPSSVPASIDI